MYKHLKHSIRSKLFAGTLGLCLLVGSLSPTTSYAEVIDGEIPVKAVITLGENFYDINTGTETTDEDYRDYFTDMVDTSRVLEDEFELNKKQLKKMVSTTLKEFETEAKEHVREYKIAYELYEERLEYFKMIESAIMNTGVQTSNENDALIYTVSKTQSDDYTQLVVNTDESWALTERKNGIVYNLASVLADGQTTIKLNSDYNDLTMISMNEDSIYIGAMADFINRHGLGTRYDEDGYIDHGRFDNDVRDGLHYIYNIEDQYEVVTQYKTGIKHGMSSYRDLEDNNLYVRVFINNKINGSTYSEIANENYTAEVMGYYEEDEKLPIIYVNYPDNGLRRMVIGTEEESVEIYDSETHGRLFISEFKDGQPYGFGYSLYGEIEYIGTFKGFDITAEGRYYNINEEDEHFEDKLNSIIDNIIERDMTDRQKLLAVHDYVVENVDYHKPYAKDLSEHPSIVHTAYGAIMNGSAVCDGYAQAFKVLIDKLGFENHLIFGITANASGEFSEDNRHAWNIVKYNGEYTHFDTTWNDPTYSDRIRHTYYFMDTDEIRNDHKWINEDYDEYLAPTTTK